MALTETTTLRVPTELRDEIAGLARLRGTTMLDVVTEAIRRLHRDQWWESVHDSLDQMNADDVAVYRDQMAQLDSAAASDLHDH